MNEWHSMIARSVEMIGPVVGKNLSGPVQFHHVVGRKYKQNKILIGPYFVNPMPFDLHDADSNNALNVTYYRHRFTKIYGTQRDLWMGRTKWMQDQEWELPFGQDVIDAIMETKF